MPPLRQLWIGSIASLALAVSAGAEDTGAFFRERVEPLLSKHCYSCHSHQGRKMKGGLTLDSRAGWAKGGVSGPAVAPGEPDQSLLIKAVRGQGDGARMPPAQALPDADIEVLVRWVKSGAPDPRVTAPTTGDWWSLKPIVKPAVPEVGGSPSAGLNPIDAFLVDELNRRGLSPSRPADPRTLIRRVTFDLHGLPPTPEEVEAFVAASRVKPQAAYEELVDRLLASPRYGERWARRWLDVVHYGESNGFGMDRPRFNAWPYRDYVINSFNQDKPYARFVQEQFAADALFPDQPELIPALGFAAAGPFNQSALAEQVDGTDCKKIALNLDRDDMVGTVGNTFLSLTIQCARCHEHKFDPIPQRDYYRLQAVFAGVGRIDRPYDADRKVGAARRDLTRKLAALEKNPAAEVFSEAELKEIAAARPAWEEAARRSAAVWTVLTGVEARSIAGTTFTELPDGSILCGGTRPDTDNYTITARTAVKGVTAVRLEVLPDDSLPAKGPGRAENGNFHLSEFRVAWAPAGEPERRREAQLVKATADFDQAGWEIAKAIDGERETAWGVHPQEGKAHWAVFELKAPMQSEGETVLKIRLHQFHGRSHVIGRFRLAVTNRPPAARKTEVPADIAEIADRWSAFRTPEQQARLAQYHRLAWVRAKLAALPPQQKVFALAADFPAFRNYKPVKEPRPIHLLRRGDIGQPTELVTPGALGCAGTLKSDLDIADAKDEAQRRAALARWITDPANPLTWRSIVNRAWQYHFGCGIVDSPNDFGRMGSKPSHPALLDWLAAEFRDRGGSIKQLDRLIVTSAAYRQVSDHNADKAAVDADNRLLWRMNRTRLDAEEVRDTLLAVSGRLDPTMGGPSVMQFKFLDPNKEVSPQIDFDGFDPDDPAGRRRGVYRFLFRNVTDPLLEAFDVPDPSLSVARRNVTVTPQQALSLLNNRFVLRHCEHLASRVEREAFWTAGRVDRACRLVLGRAPDPDESVLLAEYANRHGLAAACRLLVNCNDFLFVH